MPVTNETVRFRGDTTHYDEAVKRLEGGNKRIKRSFAGLALKVTGLALAFEGIRRAIAAPIAMFARYETHVVGLQKVLKGTADVQANVVKQVTKLAGEMPVATNELLRMAAAGAQMGVADENVKDFTASMVKLKATTNITEDLSLSFGRLQKFAQLGFQELSSILVSLGNNMAATEAEILFLATRVTGRFGALKEELKFTGDQMLAVAGHMAAADVEAQAGATAFRKWGQSLAEALSGNQKKMEALQKIMGLTADEIRAMGSAQVWEEFLRGVRRAGSGSQELLQDLDVGGSIAVGVINQLTGTVDDLSLAFGLAATEAANGGKAIEDEYGKTLDTLTSKWEILGNNVERVARNLTEKLAPAMNTILDVMNRMTGATDTKFLQGQNEAIRTRIDQLLEQRRVQGQLAGIDQQEYEALHAQLSSNLRDLSPTQTGGGSPEAMKNRKRKKVGITPAKPETKPTRADTGGGKRNFGVPHRAPGAHHEGHGGGLAEAEVSAEFYEERWKERKEKERELAERDEAERQEMLELSMEQEREKWQLMADIETAAVSQKNARLAEIDQKAKEEEAARQKKHDARMAKAQQLADDLFVNLANTRSEKLAKIGRIGMIWKQAVATADAVKAGAGLPFPANLAAIASGVAAVVTNFAALKFADGGIVPGGAPYTDRIPAVLTPGEVVLNRDQQMALLRGGGRGIDYDRMTEAVSRALEGDGDNPGLKVEIELVGEAGRLIRARTRNDEALGTLTRG